MLIMILSDKSIAVIFCFDFLLKYTERCVYKILLFEKISLQFSGYADFRGGGSHSFKNYQVQRMSSCNISPLNKYAHQVSCYVVHAVFVVHWIWEMYVWDRDSGMSDSGVNYMMANLVTLTW